MILACPSCRTRYVLDAKALGAKGRTVRCAKCHHTWHQAPPPDKEIELTATPVAAPQAAPNVEAATIEAPAPEAADGEPRRRLRASERQRTNLPAIAKPKRRWGPALAAGVAFFAIVAGVGYAAIVERDRIVSYMPSTAAFFASVGFPASDNGVGLEFRNVTTTRDIENGLPTLVIDGQVTNVSSVARAVPKLVVILRDKGERDLQDWTVSVPKLRLNPGESAPFHTSVTQPAEAASGVVVTFAGGEGG